MSRLSTAAGGLLVYFHDLVAGNAGAGQVSVTKLTNAEDGAGAAVAGTTANPFVTSDVGVGAPTEAAPANDTASAGLNGRLQRVAQRLTSLIALLPASLGAKAGAASLSVVPATDAVFATAASLPVTQYAAAAGFVTTASAAFTLAAGAVTTGVAIPAGSYISEVIASALGLKLQALGADGTTYFDLHVSTAASERKTIVAGNADVLRVQNPTGAAITGIRWTLK